MDVDVGSRVTYGASGKTGTVRYIGEVDSLSGEWAGIELDKPDGKHNGELNGRVYFTCPPNHGVFVKKAQLRALGAARSGGTSASPTTRGGSAASTSRFGATGASSASGATSTTASRLQQMRERRASGIGLSSSSSSSFRSTTSATPGAVSPGTRESRLSLGGPAATSALRRTPSSTSTSSASSRLSTDSSARRLSMGRTAPPLSSSASVSSSTSSAAAATAAAAASEELAEAKARIAKLEEDLEDRNRHVEQLKQNLVALRESHERAAAADATNAEDAVEDEPSADDAMEVDDTGVTDERVWIEKIEAIRQEAEEHVRTVRAELEDHIAQIQSDHEELQDELRLENATQSSEIKSLEAEVAQQKARLAQFTSSEQKKAEEVAHAMAKTSAGARKVESLEMQLNEYQEMVETLTLEKETLEMDKEIAEERVEELVSEVERLKTSIALAASTTAHATHVSGSSASASEVAEENLKLRAAIKALHDRSSEEKNELNRKLRQLQRETAELQSLREEVEQLSTKKTKLEGEVEELKELLDVANVYESMVEDLTEKNLTLGDKVAELEASVGTLESLKELSEEVEHQQNEYVAELTGKIESQQARMQELKNVITEQQTVIEDKDRTIVRFRDATNRSREDMSQLKAQLRAETGELESLKGTAHSAMNQTMMLRTLAASARENEAEAAKQRINADQARLENAFLRAAIPNSIFSEMDQKVLRVRLRLGRLSGKADILLQNLRKDLDGIVQYDPQDETSLSVLDSERTIQQLVLGDKLASLACGAKEDLFVLECHLTTAEDYAATCARLDTTQAESLEMTLDSALIALADSTLFVSRAGEASTYNRLLSIADEWIGSRTSTSNGAEGFSTLCAVVKYRSKQSITRLAFAFAEMLTFIRTVKVVVTNPETILAAETKEMLVSLFDRVAEEYLALLKLAQHLHRRGDIDLAWADDDLDGSVAVGGDVIELLYGFADEALNLWTAVQDQLSIAKVQTGHSEDIASFTENSLLVGLSSLKERLASLFKSVCRGAFIDAVSSRSRDRIDLDSGNEGRPQWQIRAQAIQKELLSASSIQASLKETNELSQLLHTRVRELERADSQHRVVAQKLESEVLRLSDTLAQVSTEKTRLDEQLAREREQFTIALDESHKDKAALDNANRELRKQLKRSSDMGASSAAMSASAGRNKSALSHGDADAFRRAFQHLHGELHRVRAALAKERLDTKLGPALPLTAAQPPSDRLVQCAKDVSLFARQVKSQLSMPRMVDLSQPSSARDQLVQKKLEHAQILKTLSDLRTRISNTVQGDGWNGDIANAIGRGENVFGWRPPEMERPPVLWSRVTLQPLRPLAPPSGSADQEMEDVSTPPAAPVQLILNQSQVKRLTQTLVC